MLINISDHYTRTKVASPASNGVFRVMGCLLGQQSGRVVDISNSFEIKYERGDDGSIAINDAFLQKKMEQCECEAWAGVWACCCGRGRQRSSGCAGGRHAGKTGW